VKQSQLQPKFVEFIPESIEEGILYIAMEYRTTAHLCCCGCRSPVYLPLSPTQWRLTFDGESIWIDPSVGSWSLPCQSHYWIRGNRIEWSTQWSAHRIAAAREHDRRQREDYLSPRQAEGTPHESNPPPGAPSRSRWARLKGLFQRR
jgi:hypothetical protein